MKYLFLSILTISLGSCEKTNPVPGAITYPEYHDGKINLLAVEADTVYINTLTYFTLAANVPANRSIKFVLQPVVQPATYVDWGSLGMDGSPSNPHLEWDFSDQRMIYNSLAEEFEEDKFCVTNGQIGPVEPWTTSGVLHLIIYEDQTEWITRYITLVPI